MTIRILLDVFLAFAIGAVDFRKAASPEPQVFSSFAGTLPDGSATEVVLTSFDGVNTNVPTIGQDDVAGIPIYGDEFKNFFGTSASVVHVAAAFALMESALQRITAEGDYFQPTYPLKPSQEPNWECWGPVRK